MNDYLIELINRMNDESDQKMVAGYESSKTISWKAFREAEKIENPEYIDELISYIQQEKNKKNRNRAYFVLGKIAKNIDDKKTAQFFINRIEKETDKYVIMSMLDRLEDIDKPQETNILPLIDATKNKKWQIRLSAIDALNLTTNELAENRLIEILSNSKDTSDLTCSNSVLGKIGTRKSIPFLKKMLDVKSQDVANSALYALMKIAKETEIDTYRERLEKGKQKGYAISGVIEYGDEKDINRITKRIKELLIKKRKVQVILENGKTEIIISLEFLKMFNFHKEKYNKLLNWLIEKKKDKLWEMELNWIEKEALTANKV